MRFFSFGNSRLSPRDLACPSGSIKQNLFEDEEIIGEIEGLLA
jgi:hypothetical protein